MPFYDVVLGKTDLELLGTESQEQAERTLDMLAEVALGQPVEQVLLPPPGEHQNPASEP